MSRLGANSLGPSDFRAHNHSSVSTGGDGIQAVSVDAQILSAAYVDFTTAAYNKMGEILQLKGAIEFFSAASGGLGIINPTIAGNQNNYNPAGMVTASIIVLDCSTGSRTVTGFAVAGFTGERKLFWLFPTDLGGGTLTLPHASGSSSAGNRFSCPNNTNVVLNPGDGVLIMYLPEYDSTNAFKIVGVTSSGGSLADHTHNVSGDGGDTVDAVTLTAINTTLFDTQNGGSWVRNGIITPAIAANQNNWNPAGLADASVIVVDCGAAGRTITGMQSSSMIEGQKYILTPINLGGGTFTLPNGSASSTAGNRWACPNGVNYVMPAGNSCEFIYLPTAGANNTMRILGSVI